MVMLIENGHNVGYYFGTTKFVFKEVEGAIEVEAEALLSCEKMTACIAASTWAKLPIPVSHRWSEKQSIRWLLQEGYLPYLKGKSVKFYSLKQCEPSTLSSTSSASSSKQSTCVSSSQASSSQPIEPVVAPSPRIDKIRMQHANRYIDRAIAHYYSQIARSDPNLPEGITCPITQEIMKDPVIDENGHTFERAAIEEWMSKNTTCPLGRELLSKKLNPNFSLKAILDNIWSRPPIPLLPTMTGTPFTQNDTVVKPLLVASEQFSNNHDPLNAIQMMTAAFMHTGKSEDYELLPKQYVALNQPEKAILAALYLGKRKIAEGKLEEAIHWFGEALNQAPSDELLLAAHAASRLETREAAADFKSLAQRKRIDTPREEEEAIHYWESALMSDPQRKDLYGEVIPLTNRAALFNLCLKGVLETHQEDPTYAATLYQRAIALQPDNPLPHLVRLSRLEETDPQRFEVITQLCPERQTYFLQLSLTKAFEEIRRLKQELKTSQEIASLSEKVARLEREVFPSPVDTPVAFGATEWNYYFGDVGIEPPLPPDINEILSSRCPFWPDKKVKDTHFLLLIPATIDGSPFTLQLIQEKLAPHIIKRRAERYEKFTFKNLAYEMERAVPYLGAIPYPSDRVKALFQTTSRNLQKLFTKQQVLEPYWTLMSKDLLPGTVYEMPYGVHEHDQGAPQKAKKEDYYEDQKRTLEWLTKRLPRLTGAIPNLLETVTFSLVWFAKKGTFNVGKEKRDRNAARFDYQKDYYLPRVCSDSPPFPEEISALFWKEAWKHCCTYKYVKEQPCPPVPSMRWVVKRIDDESFGLSFKFDKTPLLPLPGSGQHYDSHGGRSGIACSWRL